MLANTDAVAADPQAGAGLPKVVVIVRGLDSKYGTTTDVPRPDLEEIDEAAGAYWQTRRPADGDP